MQVLFSTISLVWYDSGAPGTSMAHAWTSAAKLVMGAVVGFCAVNEARKARDMMNPRHAGTVLLGALAVLLGAADARLARSEEPAPAAAAPPHANCQPAAFRVVVDVGHTLDVPGALSARGMPEYAFNLQLAQQIKKTLVDAGFDKTVLLITAKAPPVGLFERAMIANRLPADLFISIHHDSVPDNLIHTWQYEGQDQQYNDDYPGYALFISNDNADRAGSLQFGKFLGKALQARGLQFTPHYTLALMGNRRRQLLDADAGVYRYDQLVVLRYTRMPALLLEAGSIVNRQEELELATPERRTLISEAVAAAVEDFCAAQAHPKIEQPVKRPAKPRTASPGAVAR
jgi:N-acetylmuramoyl-L-alanine amidase